MSWLEVARRVKASHSFAVVSDSGAPVDPSVAYRRDEGVDSEPGSDGAMVLDVQTASLLVNIHAVLSPERQSVFAAMPLTRAVRVAWRVLELKQASSGGAA